MNLKMFQHTDDNGVRTTSCGSYIVVVDEDGPRIVKKGPGMTNPSVFIQDFPNEEAALSVMMQLAQAEQDVKSNTKPEQAKLSKEALQGLNEFARLQFRRNLAAGIELFEAWEQALESMQREMYLGLIIPADIFKGDDDDEQT